MKKQLLNYEALLKVTNAISHSKDPEEVALITVESIKTVFEAKGCALFLINRKTKEFALAASYGLSDEYLNKGPIHAMRSIAQMSGEGPMVIHDVMNDPRIQYPKEAQKEGISSILSVPIVVSNKFMGAMRVYSSEPWEASMDDINIVQALAQIAGMAINLARHVKGFKSSIDVLKTMRNARPADLAI